jgi:hypothetical protein
MTPEIATLLNELANIDTRVMPLFNVPMSQFDGRRALQELRLVVRDTRCAVRGIIHELALIDDLLHNSWNCFQSNGEDEVACRNLEMLTEELSDIAASAAAYDYLVHSNRVGLFHSPLGDIDAGDPCWDDFGITDEVRDLILFVEAWVEYQHRDATPGYMHT